MKTPVTGLRQLISISVVLATLCSSLAAADADGVVAPSKRLDALAQAKELLAEKTASFSGKNPFNPEGFGESSSVNTQTQGPLISTVPVGPRSGRDLLQAIAAGLKPRLIVLGGQPELFFGQKRVKAGGSLTITFEGSEYTLEVVSIDQPNFTLRLSREEFTRPIK
jgi:hypothetical protein